MTRPSGSRKIVSIAGGGPQRDLLECRIEEDSGAALLHVSGEVDLFTAPLLRSHLELLVQQGKNVAVVLTDVRFIDMAGIRTLEHCHRLAEERGSRVVLASPSAMVRRVFEILGIHRTFDILPTPVAALGHLRSGTFSEGAPGDG
ncbi:MAG: STAS domain-containing protein [bacterium]